MHPVEDVRDEQRAEEQHLLREEQPDPESLPESNWCRRVVVVVLDEPRAVPVAVVVVVCSVRRGHDLFSSSSFFGASALSASTLASATFSAAASALALGFSTMVPGSSPFVVPLLRPSRSAARRPSRPSRPLILSAPPRDRPSAFPRCPAPAPHAASPSPARPPSTACDPRARRARPAGSSHPRRPRRGRRSCRARGAPAAFSLLVEPERQRR